MLLVLLPLVALGIVGWLSLERDQATVERHARDKTSAAATRWLRLLAEVPDGEPAPDEADVLDVRWDSEGVLLQPSPAPEVPMPATWLENLPGDVRDALESARSARFAGRWSEVEQAVGRFADATNLPPELHAVLAWIRWEEPPSQGRSPADAAAAWELAQKAGRAGWQVESGLPLAPLIALRLLQSNAITPPVDLSEGWLRTWVIDQPSVLSGALLAAWKAREPTRATNLAREFQRDARARAMASSLSGILAARSAGSPAVFHGWPESSTQRWWVRIESGTNGHRARALAASRVEERLRAAIQRAGDPGWADGMAAVIDVAGSKVTAGLAPVGPEFPEPGSPGEVVSTEGSVRWGNTDADRIPFRLRVALVDPDRLFVAQRRQRLLFAGLLAGAMSVAGIGLWQTHRAFERQQRLAEVRSNFVSAVSHELRAPLASMRLLAEGMVQGRVEEPAKRREYAAFLLQETRRLAGLVENVLDASRIDQGRKRYEFAPLDLVRLVQESVRIPAPLAEDRGVRIEVRMKVQPGTSAREIVGDALALQQALLNLLDNALKHAPRGSVVEVELERDAACELPVRLSVRDHGPGIPREEQGRIFEPFYRLGGELRRETTGVGLGLALVRHAVEAHGGRVSVVSQPGQGAIFRMEWPRTPPGFYPEPDAPEPAA